MLYIAKVSYQTWFKNDESPVEHCTKMHTLNADSDVDAEEKIEDYYKDKCTDSGVQYDIDDLELSVHIS